MTVTTPERTELTDLAGLDFDAPVLCDVGECHDDKITAREATVQLVLALVCCTNTSPCCKEHAEQAREARDKHHGVTCSDHRVMMCGCTAIRIEPLP